MNMPNNVIITIFATFVMPALSQAITPMMDLPIESAQREFQARHKYIFNNYVTWPNSICCDGGSMPASRFPPDDFYSDEQKSNPNTAAQLVADLAGKFYGAQNVAHKFLVSTPEGISSYSFHTNMPDVGPVTIHNYKQALHQIRENLRQLTMIPIGVTDGVTSDWTWNGIDQLARTHEKIGGTCDEAKSLCSPSWNNYVCPHDYYYPHCETIYSEETSRILGAATYAASLTALRSRLWANLENKNGRAECYVRLKVRDGANGLGGHASPVPVDGLYHHFDSAIPGDENWRSKYMPEQLPSFSSSACASTNSTVYGWQYDDAVIVNWPEFITEADSSIRCQDMSNCSGAGCGTGDFSSELGSIAATISLGKNADGNYSGSLMLHEREPDVWIANPRSLKSFAQGAHIITAVTNETFYGTNTYSYISKIRVDNGLFRVSISNDLDYTVEVYGVGDYDDYPPYDLISGSIPKKMYRIFNPDYTNSNNRLHIDEIGDYHNTLHAYTWNTNGSIWMLSRIAGDVSIHEQKHKYADIGGSLSFITNIFLDAASNVVSREAENIYAYPWGKEVVQRILDPGGVGLLTIYSYYTNKLSNPGGYGRLEKIIRPNGNWERYEYDSGGRVTAIISQYLNNSHDSTPGVNDVVSITYTRDGPQSVETRVRTIAGVDVAKEYKNIRTNEIVDIICVDPAAGINDSGNLVKTNTYYALSYSAAPPGSLRKVSHYDGRITMYTYSSGSFGRSVVEETGVYENEYEYISSGVRRQRIVDNSGMVRETRTRDIESWVTTDSMLVVETNIQGQATKINYHDGTYETYEYTCCGNYVHRDRSGVVTEYQADALGVSRIRISDNVEYKEMHDPMGNLISSERYFDGLLYSGEYFHYNAAGQVTSKVGAVGDTIAMTEVIGTNGMVVKTTSYPDGGSVIESYYQDGRLYSIVGSATTPRRYEYGLESNRLYVVETALDENGADLDWKKIWHDGADRVDRVDYSNGSYEQFTYNNKGQLERERNRDGLIRLYAYNALGAVEDTALIIDGNGESIHYQGSDRIQRTISSIEYLNGRYVQVTREYTWPTEGEDAPILIRERLVSTNGLDQRDVFIGRTNIMTTTIMSDGSRYVTNALHDGTYTVTIHQKGRPMLITRYDANGGEVQMKQLGYDIFGRNSTVWETGKGIVSNFFDAADRVVSSIAMSATPAEEPQITEYQYDEMGRMTAMVLPDSSVTSNIFDQAGRLTRTSGSRTYPVTYAYDAQGRMTEMSTWQDYSAGAGLATTRWVYDPASGYMIAKVYEGGSSNTYTYSLGGRLASRIWARGVVTSYAYNEAGDLESVAYSDGTPGLTNQYNRVGQLVGVSDASGSRVIHHSTAGQITGEIYTNGLMAGLAIGRQYNQWGGLTTLVWSGVSTESAAYDYNPAARLAFITRGLYKAEYTYHAGGHLISGVVHKAGGAPFLESLKGYDGFGRLTSMRHDPSSDDVFEYTYNYNMANQRVRSDYTDGSYWVYEYDGLGQVIRANRYWSNGVPVAGQAYAYGYDDIGNRMVTTNNGDMSVYSVNLLNQYVERGVPGRVSVIGSALSNAVVTVNNQLATRQQNGYFHWAGEITNHSTAVNTSISVVAVLQGAATNGADIVAVESGRMFVAKTPEIFTYDLDGNMVTDGQWTNTWDGENRLVRRETISGLPETLPKVRIEYTYDGGSRRIAEARFHFDGTNWNEAATTRFLFGDWLLLAEVNASNEFIRTYVWGLDASGTMQGAGGIGGLLSMRQDNADFAYAYDGNGNVAALVDNNGDAVALYEYGPFGESIRTSTKTESLINKYRFSTKWEDHDSGLIYYGHRFYSPELGRWLSRDPIEEKGGINLYGFVKNDSINNVDKLGLFNWGSPIKTSTSSESVNGKTYTRYIPKDVAPLPGDGKPCCVKPDKHKWRRTDNINWYSIDMSVDLSFDTGEHKELVVWWETCYLNDLTVGVRTKCNNNLSCNIPTDLFERWLGGNYLTHARIRYLSCEDGKWKTKGGEAYRDYTYSAGGWSYTDNTSEF